VSRLFRRKRRIRPLAVGTILSLLAVMLMAAPAGAGAPKVFTFTFENGITITGESEDNVAFLADAGGADANNPTGMEIHVSCSDDFPGGFGEKDGPDPIVDSAWQIASYSIGEVKDGVYEEKCSGPPVPGEIKDGKGYTFNFVNGITITGASESTDAFIPNAGGTDVNNPTGMEVHLSCSDDFPGGFSEKAGPDPVVDSAWQIESYEITEIKDFQVGEIKCSGNFGPPPPPPAPSIQIVKTVNGEDANTAPGVAVNVGDTVTLGYEVTNNGNITVQDIVVTDLDLGVIDCPKTELAPGESMDCDEATMDVTEPGGVFMEARVDGNGIVSGTPTPPTPADGYGYSFTFENGTTISGVSDNNTVFLANAGGTDANNPTGMEVHVSCSDDFPGGFGEKDGPDPAADSAWKIASYTIVKDNGDTCGNVFSTVKVPVSDDDPINYIASEAPVPSISLMKTVNGDDANSAPGPQFDVGDEIMIGYKITNTGNTDLSDIEVDDQTFGVIDCDPGTLAPGEMFNCPGIKETVTTPGSVFMEAEVEGTSPQGVTVTDDDPINFVVVDDTPPPLDPPADCSAVVDGMSVKISWDASAGAVDYAVKSSLGWLGRTGGATMFTDTPPKGVMVEYFVRAIGPDSKTGYVSCGKVTIPDDPDPDPSISLMKTVNGDDANSAPGPQFEVGETITIGYKITNTGDTDLSNIVVDDAMLGVIACDPGTLGPDDMFNCPDITKTVTTPGSVFMEAEVEGTSPQGVTVTDDDPINFTVVDDTPPPLDPPADCSAVVDGMSVKISWDASPGAVNYAVKRDGTFLDRTGGATMFTDTPPKGVMVEYFVRAIGADDKTDYVSCGKVTIPDDPGPDPVPPAECTVSYGDGGATISWSPVDGAKAYQVRSNGQWIVRVDAHTTSYLDIPPRDGYTVEAVYSGNVKSSRTVCEVIS